VACIVDDQVPERHNTHERGENAATVVDQVPMLQSEQVEIEVALVSLEYDPMTQLIH